MRTSIPPPSPRRHDLDALRAVAMLLGIVLHCALSFVAFPWVVQDTRQHEGFGLLFFAVHGFRMPLFFVMSGFFTAMLWRRRGLRALIRHRFLRIFCPLLLGMITIVPIMNVVSGFAITSGMKKAMVTTGAQPEITDLWGAVKQGDADALSGYLVAGADLDVRDDRYGVTPLSWAVLAGHTEVAELLIENGADVDARHQDGATALHAAAVFGRTELMRLLLANGADVHARNNEGRTALDTTKVDFDTAQFLAALFAVELDEAQTRRGWEASAELLRAHGAVEADVGETEGFDLPGWLYAWPVFHHLWFLWHLCWLVAGFALVVLLSPWLRFLKPPAWLMLSPVRFLWLIPLTMLPMSVVEGFGPDTSAGILIMPHVLATYAIFFGFGALYYHYDDPGGRVGRGWWVTLPVGLLVVLPLGLSVVFEPHRFDPETRGYLNAFLQAAYPWLLTFGFMGLFRRWLSVERAPMRYVSDASYWLYLAHLPLVILAQVLVRDWPLAALPKFLLISVAISAVLLLSYRWMVRYTWIGALLNGRRTRP